MPSPAPLSDTASRAFPSHPRLDRYFPSASAEEVRTRLTSCVERGEGPALLIGAAGAGKTMLLEVLSETFGNRFSVVNLAGAQLCTRRALLQSILHGLELSYRNREEGELRLAISGFLNDATVCPAGVALLIDEAHTLSPRLLEELRVLGNLARGGEPLVRLVLAGTTALEERLAAPEMETLNQRIAARCYLSPMTYDELVQYVRAHIAATGANPDELLSVDAAAAVFEATDGIPRLVNQLCDRAIVLAVAAGSQVIDRSAIQNAWSDLHQLPAPWHDPEPEAFAAENVALSFPAPAEGSSEAEGSLEEGVLLEEPPHGPAAVEGLSLEGASSESGGGGNNPYDGQPVVAQDATVEAAPEEIVEAEAAAPIAVWNADSALSQVLGAEPVVVSSLADAEPDRLPEAAGTPGPFEVLEVPETPPAAERAADPFGDDFEEEETLLDPYAGLDRLFPPGTPVVSNQEDDTISTLVATLAPEFDAPEFDAEDETEIDEPEGSDVVAMEVPVPVEASGPAEGAVSMEGFERFATEGPTAEQTEEPPAPQPTAAVESIEEPKKLGLAFPGEASGVAGDVCEIEQGETNDLEDDLEDELLRQVEAMDVGDDPAVLLIEEDAGNTTAESVYRQEYRQLFASLRGG